MVYMFFRGLLKSYRNPIVAGLNLFGILNIFACDWRHVARWIFALSAWYWRSLYDEENV